MGREIVNLSAGQAGNTIGLAFWQEVCKEHGIEGDGSYTGHSDEELERIDVFFQQSSKSARFVPRTVTFDLEPGVLNKIYKSSWGGMFNPASKIHAASGAANNWAKGHYTEGAELIDEVMDQTRKLAEDCDMLQGFMIQHSIGGGTGSGMGTLLLSKVREEYPDRIVQTYSIYPSPKVSDVVVEPYNAILSIHQLIENADQVMVIDNEALYDICFRELGAAGPTFEMLNGLIANSMSGTTCCLRFAGQLNSDMRKLGVNLVPFPRLHFFITSISPLFSEKSADYQNIKAPQLTQQCFDPMNTMVAVDPRNGKFMTCALTYRGEIAMKDVDEQVVIMQNRDSDYFCPWIPNNIKASHCSIAKKGVKTSCSFLGNSTAMMYVYERMVSQYRDLYSRKAYLHWYTGEGMDEAEFTEGENNVVDLMEEYSQYADAGVSDDEENQ